MACSILPPHKTCQQGKLCTPTTTPRRLRTSQPCTHPTAHQAPSRCSAFRLDTACTQLKQLRRWRKCPHRNLQTEIEGLRSRSTSRQDTHRTQTSQCAPDTAPLHTSRTPSHQGWGCTSPHCTASPQMTQSPRSTSQHHKHRSAFDQSGFGTAPMDKHCTHSHLCSGCTSPHCTASPQMTQSPHSTSQHHTEYS